MSGPNPLLNIHAAYQELGQTVTTALQTQARNAHYLHCLAQDCMWFLQRANQHAHNIPEEELYIIRDSIASMVACLDDATHLTTDPPDQAFPSTTQQYEYTGHPGRPRKVVDPQLLAITFNQHGPTALAEYFDCCARTVWQHALDYGLAQPGEAVFFEYESEEGATIRIYNRSSTGAVSDISNDTLNDTVHKVIESFPSFGWRMFYGHLKFMGLHVPHSCVEAFYNRIQGAPTQGFGVRRVLR
ncbi:hypothetical protein EDD85DRAFT_957389 [Armillaria nabsnona]|nr:hypothetical protein EDD85DRAFT_957389 [Armillaria nabsnona]